MENIELKKLRNQLPHGAQTKIAENANVHLNLVYRVLNGKSKNLMVLQAIANYLKDHNKVKSETLESISSLID